MPHATLPGRKVEPLPCLRGEAVRLAPAKSPYFSRLENPGGPAVLDLFCGAGGMSLGFALAGFRVAGGIDANAWAMETHAHHFGGYDQPIILSDQVKPQDALDLIGIREADVLIGGPPCQGFARVGRGKLRSLVRQREGEEEALNYDDPRNFLYRSYLSFVEILRPGFLVMENVPDMLRHHRGSTVNGICRDLEGLGYRAEARILDASRYGVPQTRQRMILIANRQGVPVIWPDPSAKPPVTLMQAISDLPRVQPEESADILPYTGRAATAYARLMRAWLEGGDRRVVYDHVVRRYAADDQAAFRVLAEGQRYTDLPEDLRRYRSDIFDDKYHKLFWNRPAWTVTAHIAKDGYKYIHPDTTQLRTITAREAARIQSFPDWFRFAGYRTNRLTQIGNAVPPRLAQAIAAVMIRQL